MNTSNTVSSLPRARKNVVSRSRSASSQPSVTSGKRGRPARFDVYAKEMFKLRPEYSYSAIAEWLVKQKSCKASVPGVQNWFNRHTNKDGSFKEVSRVSRAPKTPRASKGVKVKGFSATGKRLGRPTKSAVTPTTPIQLVSIKDVPMYNEFAASLHQIIATAQVTLSHVAASIAASATPAPETPVVAPVTANPVAEVPAVAPVTVETAAVPA